MSLRLSASTMSRILTDRDSLKYVKSAKASTDVPGTVSQTTPVLQWRLTSNALTSGSRIHISMSTLAEWLPLCVHSLYSIFHPVKTFYAKIYCRYIYIRYSISILWRVNHDAHFTTLAGIYLQRRATRVHLDITCKLLPCLLLCKSCNKSCLGKKHAASSLLADCKIFLFHSWCLQRRLPVRMLSIS